MSHITTSFNSTYFLQYNITLWYWARHKAQGTGMRMVKNCIMYARIESIQYGSGEYINWCSEPCQQNKIFSSANSFFFASSYVFFFWKIWSTNDLREFFMDDWTRAESVYRLSSHEKLENPIPFYHLSHSSALIYFAILFILFFIRVLLDQFINPWTLNQSRNMDQSCV